MIIIGSIQIILVFLFVIVCWPLYFISYRLNHRYYYKLASDSCKIILFLLGIRLKIKNIENINKAGKNYIIAANHQSYLDIPVLDAITPCTFIQRPVVFMPGFSWHFGKVSLVIERDNPSSVIKAVRYIKRVAIGEETPVVIFPESTRSLDGRIGGMRIGAAAIAKNMGLPILPVTIVNSIEMLSRKKLLHNSGVIRVVIHPPIEADYLSGHAAEEITADLKKIFEQGLAA